MLSTVNVVRSPDWWFARLAKKLAARRPLLDELDGRAKGDPPIPPEYDDAGIRDAYVSFLRRARTPLLGLVSGAVAERLQPLGIRTGAVSDEVGDAEAWRYWQHNEMDYWFGVLAESTLNLADSYAMVGPGKNGPRITVEDPRAAITEEDPVTGDTIAALKLWHDDIDEVDRAVVQVLDPQGRVHVVHYRAQNKTSRWSGNTVATNAWSIDVRASGVTPVNEILVTRFANRRDLFGNTRSEFADVIDIQDRIDRQTFDRMVIAAAQSFRQRWVKMDKMPTDADGRPIENLNDLLRSEPNAVWALLGDVEFGEFGTADLTQLLKANEADIMAMAKVSRTPAQHLLGGDLVNVGADAYTASLDPFLAKVNDRIRQFSEPLERLMSHVFLVAGDSERAQRGDMEILWANPQRYTLSEKSDAAVKQRGLVSDRTIKRDVLQMTPQAIARDEADKAADQLEQELTNADAPTSGSPSQSEGSSTRDSSESGVAAAGAESEPVQPARSR